MLSFLKDFGNWAILLSTPVQICAKYICYFDHQYFVSPRAYRACVIRNSRDAKSVELITKNMAIYITICPFLLVSVREIK